MTKHPDSGKPHGASASTPRPSDVSKNPVAPRTPTAVASESAVGASTGAPLKIAHNELLSDHSNVGLDAKRRAHERLPFVALLTVHHIDANDSVSPGLRCPALDISVGGLSFRSRRSYWKDDRLLVLIQTKDHSTRIVFAAVRHCAYDGGGNHRIGVQFIESPKSKRILSWLAENVVE
ncbi:MAG: PilZ domain-containing protein [Phycisphaerales bacterium]|nr:PilZ domain-containing protein [Phycisphaerales bacterium]